MALIDQVRTLLSLIPSSFDTVILAESINEEYWHQKELWAPLLTQIFKLLWVDTNAENDQLSELLSQYSPDHILAVLNERLSKRVWSHAAYLVEISSWTEADKEERLLKDLIKVMVLGLSKHQSKLSLMRDKIQFLLEKDLTDR